MLPQKGCKIQLSNIILQSLPVKLPGEEETFDWNIKEDTESSSADSHEGAMFYVDSASTIMPYCKYKEAI